MNDFFDWKTAQCDATPMISRECKMRWILYPLVLVSSLTLSTGCSSVDRSRDLGDPNVPAIAIAQQVCSNCHGMNGYSVSPNFPNLAGQTKIYFVEQLKSFRSHNRSDPAGFEYMWGLSAKLTDNQIDGLAEYFESKQPVRGKPGEVSVMNRGQEIFEKGVASNNIPACLTCHGATGQGNQQFPRLAGQHADYIVKQLKVFQNTEARPEGAIMKGVAHGLSVEDMKNVAAYLQALPPS